MCPLRNQGAFLCIMVKFDEIKHHQLDDIFFKQTFKLSYYENCIVFCIVIKENKKYMHCDYLQEPHFCYLIKY